MCCRCRGSHTAVEHRKCQNTMNLDTSGCFLLEARGPSPREMVRVLHRDRMQRKSERSPLTPRTPRTVYVCLEREAQGRFTAHVQVLTVSVTLQIRQHPDSLNSSETEHVVGSVRWVPKLDEETG